jgi:hypothetical protein
LGSKLDVNKNTLDNFVKIYLSLLPLVKEVREKDINPVQASMLLEYHSFAYRGIKEMMISFVKDDEGMPFDAEQLIDRWNKLESYARDSNSIIGDF